MKNVLFFGLSRARFLSRSQLSSLSQLSLSQLSSLSLNRSGWLFFLILMSLCISLNAKEEEEKTDKVCWGRKE
jgi:hypothetical protein